MTLRKDVWRYRAFGVGVGEGELFTLTKSSAPADLK